MLDKSNCTIVLLTQSVLLPVLVFEGPRPLPGQLCEGEDSKYLDIVLVF